MTLATVRSNQLATASSFRIQRADSCQHVTCSTGFGLVPHPLLVPGWWTPPFATLLPPIDGTGPTHRPMSQRLPQIITPLKLLT